jgi:outer membrane lipoprotein-sorting protein
MPLRGLINNTGIMRLFGMLCLLALLVPGCAKPPEFMAPLLLPDARGIVTKLEAKRAKIKTFAFKGDVKLITPTQDLYGTHMILGKYPDRIRVELIGPFGRPVMTLISDGKFITALDMGNNKAYVGPANKRNLARFMGIALSPAEVYSLLSGCLQLDRIGDFATLASHDDLLLVRGYSQAGPGSLSLLVNPELNAVEKAWYSSTDDQTGWDEASLRIRFSELKPLAGIHIPHELWVADREGRTLTLEHDELHINKVLSEFLFTIDIPQGFPVVPLP